MEDPRDPALFPFLLRSKLDFGDSSTFNLIIDVWTGATQKVSVVGFTKAGPFSLAFIPAGTLAKETFSFPITDIPLSVTLFTTSFGLQELPTYAQAHLGINGDKTYLLAAGYVNSPSVITWPQGSPRGSFEGVGTFTSRVGTDPAANVEISQATTALLITRLLSVSFTLVADANAANRLVHLTLDDGNGVVYNIPAPGVQTANETIRYIYGLDLPFSDNSANGIMTAPLPPFLGVHTNGTIATVTDSRQVTDNYGAPTIYTEDFVLASP